MNNLWCATAMLARDPNLRAQLRNIAATAPGTFTPLDPPAFPMIDQPVPDALAGIRALFRAQTPSLFLSVFDLSEINRWMVLDKTRTPPPSDSLDQFWQAIGPILDNFPAAHQVLLEAAGVLIVDRAVRASFIAGTTNLSDCGFTFPAGAENQLRDGVRPAAVGNGADSFVDFSWPGGSCLSRMDLYDRYYHPNL